MAFKYKIKENHANSIAQILPSETAIICFEDNLAQEIANLPNIHVLHHKTATNMVICNNSHWHEMHIDSSNVEKLYQNFKLLIVQDSVKKLTGSPKTAIGMNLNMMNVRLLIEILAQTDIPQKIIGRDIRITAIGLSNAHEYDHVAILIDEEAPAKSIVPSILQLKSRSHSLHLRPRGMINTDANFTLMGIKADQTHVMREESTSFGVSPKRVPIFLLEN